MSDKFPVTNRTDVSPEKYSTPDKKKGESFNEAANRPNNPKKDFDVSKFYNITEAYCDDSDEGE